MKASAEPSSTRNDWLQALLVALILVAVTLIPVALGYAFARPGTEFMGMLMNPEDSNSYLAKMQQGYEGGWLYSIPFTTEAHAPAFLGGFYLLLGHAARFLNLSVVQMWHLARVASAVLMFMAVYGFIRHFSPDPLTRWIAYALALTGSGLGWLLFALGQNYWLGDFPVDFKMPEAHLFFAALAFPHFTLGVTLILASVWLSLRAFDTQRMLFAAGAGVANLALVIVYPFLIYLIGTVLALHWFDLYFSKRRLQLRAGIAVLVSLLIPAPLLIYDLMVLRTNAAFRAWDAQAVTPSPNPLHYLVAYGAVLVLAAPTLREREWRPLWIWVLAVALLVYAPLNPQRRFVEGVQVPLSILAAAGLTSRYLPRVRLSEVFQRLAARPHYSVRGLERLIIVGLLVLLTLSNLYVLLSTSVTAALEQPYPLFRTQAEVDAVEWAGAHLPAGAVVLSAYESGSLIPTRTGLRTVIGHWAETMDFPRKYDQVSSFFAGATSEEWRTKLLAAQHVDYLFYGPRERALGNYDPALDPDLTRAYENTAVVIYRVNKE